jgi:hypothetical protein
VLLSLCDKLKILASALSPEFYCHFFMGSLDYSLSYARYLTEFKLLEMECHCFKLGFICKHVNSLPLKKVHCDVPLLIEWLQSY